MKDSFKQKLTTLNRRYQELEGLIADPGVIADQTKYRAFNKEYAQIEPVVKCFRAYEKNEHDLASAYAMLEESDKELRGLAEQEVETLRETQEKLTHELQVLLLPKDPNDEKNVFLEIRGGAGGHEAALFAGNLFRMYSRYAESQGWRLEAVSMSEGEQGGYKQVIARIEGDRVYSRLKFESGAHRVQRVPATESQGRIHTSTCTVAIMPEVEAVDEIHIDPKELRIDTFRASGAGGQHVNKTDSAIRVTHLPTGTVVECQDERSQHKNRARALSLLQAKLLVQQQEAQRKEQAQTRKNLIGTGDRSERIRTYNFPQARVTDHRINLTIYKLDEVMEGDLNCIIDPLLREHQAQQLTELSE